LARKLSGIRDQHAAVETLEKLQLKYKNKPLYQDIKSLILSIELTENKEESTRLIHEFKNDINSSFSRINTWEITSKGFDAISGGLRKTYTRGRNAMRQAFISPTAENYHEWRKRVKYHYYHLELLIPVWRRIVKAHTNEVHSLSEKLGYDHDLSLLSESLNSSSFKELDDKTNQKILDAVMKEQSKLRRDIGILGKKIYAEKPITLVTRYARWWDIWEKER
ncbi:MAG: CHAD domain-containing protein, partial [Melioribacteraceae bacterium]|nr:CHAD domain-containing protein [Melioribacteraceae bacterium]